jgi:hypothetical protein
MEAIEDMMLTCRDIFTAAAKDILKAYQVAKDESKVRLNLH